MHLFSKSLVSLGLAGILSIISITSTQAAGPDEPTQNEPQPDGLGMIDGTVTNADGKPLRGVAIGLQFQRQRQEEGRQTPPPTTKPTPIQTTRTDRNGRYTFEKVKPGTYVVIARDSQNGNFRKQVVLGENQEVTLDMKLKPRPAPKNQPDQNNQNQANGNRNRNQN